MRKFLSIALLAAGVTVGAWADEARVKISTPYDGSTVQTCNSINISFNQEVQADSSRFKVISGAIPNAKSRAKELLDTEAGSVASKVLTHGAASDISIQTHDPLKPGTYCVVWRVVTDDGQPTYNGMTFNVAER